MRLKNYVKKLLLIHVPRSIQCVCGRGGGGLNRDLYPQASLFQTTR